MADAVLVPYDIWTNEAHVLMLQSRKIIDRADARGLLAALGAVAARHEKGAFVLEPELEDVHMNVEAAVCAECGEEIGMKIHTGRSRNDQVSCDVRMYLRDATLDLAEDTVRLVDALVDLAGRHLRTPMPGFSHTRHAAATTFAHLLGSYAQSLERDIERLRFTFGVIDRCPLGAAAGYGTSFPLDRELTADLLGFAAVQENSLDCIDSLWEVEAQLAEAICFLFNHLSTVSQDCIFLSTAEAGMIDLPDRFVQGSSIMPQKRNPDVLEVTRAKAALAHGALASLLGLGKAGLSGYNRDLQHGKSVIMDLVDECRSGPAVLTEVLPRLQVDRGSMEAFARKGFLNAVDVAECLARELSLPFRRAYHVVAEAVKSTQSLGELSLESVNSALAAAGAAGVLDRDRFEALMDPLTNASARKVIGGPAPEQVEACADGLRRRIQEHGDWCRRRRSALEKAHAKTRGLADELLR
jgi:argininosuccinate lyase